MRHVDVEHRRRLLIRRQLLGASGRGARPLDDVVGRLGLLHSTDPATPYLSLLARCDADVAAVADALHDTSRHVRHTTIRRTVFVMPLDVARDAHAAYNQALVERLGSQLLGWLDGSGEVEADAATFLAEVEAAVVARLADGPASGARLADDVPALTVRFEPSPGASWSKPMRITSKVLELLAASGRIVRAAPTGAPIVSGAWTWALPSAEAGSAFRDDRDAGAGLAGLLHHHLRAFGPSTITDLTWWTGLPKGAVRRALVSLGAEPVTVDDLDDGGDQVPVEAWVLPEDDLEISDADDPVVALLPGLDSTVMGWKQRRWFVDDRPSTGVFDRNGNAGPTVWVDGRVAGVWTQRPAGAGAERHEVGIEWLEDVGDDVVDLARIEAERIADWLGPVAVKWRYPTAITKRLVGD